MRYIIVCMLDKPPKIIEKDLALDAIDDGLFCMKLGCCPVHRSKMAKSGRYLCCEQRGFYMNPQRLAHWIEMWK